METGYLLVNGVHDVMCQVAAVLKGKAADEVICSYVITMSTVCVK